MNRNLWVGTSLVPMWHGVQERELALGTVPPGASLVYTIELVHLEKVSAAIHFIQLCHPLTSSSIPASALWQLSSSA